LKNVATFEENRSMEAQKQSSTQVSIIVPAYKEVGNVVPLTERIFRAIDDSAKKSKISRNNVELIIVDDNSCDGTEEKVQSLREKGYPIRIVVRKNEKGLSSAVLRGFQEAKGDYLLCMDADLQVHHNVTDCQI
jgi:dolichol-phosphate mannosyltransferase